jgi:hypothetical protein
LAAMFDPANMMGILASFEWLPAGSASPAIDGFITNPISDNKKKFRDP